MKTIGLIFGGKSPEHGVSLSSARGVLDNIDKTKYKVKEIFINQDGYFFSDRACLNKVVRGEESKLKKYDFFKESNKVDIYFPILHGIGGEDGEIQGLIRSVNKPFVGSDVLASALCLNKALFKLTMASENIPQLKFEILNHKQLNTVEINKKLKQIKRDFKFPVFVKAASLGSSIGIYKVGTKNELELAVKKASKYDLTVLVEESIVSGREIEVSVLGNSFKDVCLANPGEVVPAEEFYSYKDKCCQSKARTIVNTSLSNEISRQIKAIAIKAYLLVGCEGMARVDFFVSKKNKVYLNEINTIPGFTPISMYPKMWEASGLSYQNLISELIQLALKRK